MTEEEAHKQMMDAKVTPKKRGMTPQQAINFYNQYLKNPVPSPKLPDKKDPWWLKPLLFIIMVVVLACMVSMCNHSLKESSHVGIETTIRSHGD